MKRASIVFLSVMALLIPLFKAAMVGSDWGEFFFEFAFGICIAYVLYVLSDTLKRLDKLEGTDKSDNID